MCVRMCVCVLTRSTLGHCGRYDETHRQWLIYQLLAGLKHIHGANGRRQACGLVLLRCLLHEGSRASSPSPAPAPPTWPALARSAALVRNSGAVVRGR